MKIVMIADFMPRINGLSNHVNTLSKKLIKQGHEVFIITFPNKNNIKKINEIQIIRPPGKDIRYLNELTILLKGKKLLENLIQKENIDIIHAHSIFPQGTIATQIGEKYNIPTYITCHGIDFYKFYKFPFFKQHIQRVLNKADNILAVSQELADEINQTGVKNIQKKTSVHLNAVDIHRFKEIPNKTKKETPTVIFVGMLNKRKNLTTLLDAKKKSHINYQLLIVGDGPQKNKLKNKVQKENIKNVTFLGRRTDIENILPQTDLFVLPSFSEGLSVALIEALACGLPVIGSNIPGMKEAITPDVGLLINPHSSSSIRDAIDKILTNEKLYNKFKSNARKKAMQFAEMKIPYKELK